MTKLNFARAFFTIITFGIVLLVPVFWLANIDNQQENSMQERRELIQFSYKDLGLENAYGSYLRKNYSQMINELFRVISSGEFPKQLESASQDQFPLRLQMIQLKKSLDRTMIALAYLPFGNTITPIDFSSNLYIMKEEEFIIPRPTPLTPEDKEKINSRINNYSSLIEEFPDKNFYVYYIEQIQYSKLNPLVPVITSLSSEWHGDYFKQHKPSGLYFDALTFQSIEEYTNLFYKTDHHLNHFGITQIYYDIYKMLKQNYPQISDPVAINGYTTIPNLGFLGSTARSSYFPFDPEPFSIINYTVPPYTVYYEGEEIHYNQIDQYLSGQYPADKYANHYARCFGGDYGLLDFTSENDSERNLLVIGDSFDNALLPILTAHFGHLYSIDLRHWKDFTLSDFLESHQVDDILIIGNHDPTFTAPD